MVSTTCPHSYPLLLPSLTPLTSLCRESGSPGMCGPVVVWRQHVWWCLLAACSHPSRNAPATCAPPSHTSPCAAPVSSAKRYSTPCARYKLRRESVCHWCYVSSVVCVMSSVYAPRVVCAEHDCVMSAVVVSRML